MENKTKVTLLHEEVIGCLARIYFTIYQKSNNFMYTIIEIADYIISDSNKYDHILAEFSNVNKELIKQCIFTNFLTITNYRRKMNIPLCSTSKEIINLIEEEDDEQYNYQIKISNLEFVTMLKAAFSFFFSPSPIYNYNAINILKGTKLLERIYTIYPLSKLEHAMILNNEYTFKEYLFYTLIEVICNNFEKQTFLNGDTPIPDRKFLISIKELFQKYDGSNKELPNLHKSVCEDFYQRMISYDEYPGKQVQFSKMLMIEMLLNIIIAKQRHSKPLSEMENKLIESLKKVNTSEDTALLLFYFSHKQEIITTFINNWYSFPASLILEDNKILDPIRKKYTNN